MNPAQYVRRLETAIRAISDAHTRQREARRRGIFSDKPATDLTNTITDAIDLINSGPSRTTDKEPDHARPRPGPPASRSARNRYR